MQVLTLDEIKKRLNLKEAIAMQKEGFQLFSSGHVTVPPVGYMNMGSEGGEVHVKFGWIKGDGVFAVKIAGAYPESMAKVQGAILVIDAKKGAPVAFIQDEGYLTNLRTAIAGLLAAEALAEKGDSPIGILGTGIQARMQAHLLKEQLGYQRIVVWGRSEYQVELYKKEMIAAGFQVLKAASPSEVCKRCDLVVTTTSSKEPLLFRKDLRKGMHITAVGADAPGKMELEKEIFLKADRIVLDSKKQCFDHGEASHAYTAKMIGDEDVFELGAILADPSLGRQSSDEITLCDLTGIAVQDIQIAKAIFYGGSPVA